MPPHVNKVDLLRASLSDRTYKEYKSNLSQFLEFCEQGNLDVSSAERMDLALCEYAHKEFETPGRDGRQHVNKVVSAVKLLFPGMSSKLFLTHRALSGWAKLRPSQHHTPCPHDLALGISYYLLRDNKPDMALGVLLIYDCHLRLGEFLNLKKESVIIQEEPSNIIFLHLSEYKTGRNASVEVRFKLVKVLLQRYLHNMNPRQTKLVTFTGDSFRERIHAVMANRLHLTDPKFLITPHSLRRGGATRDFQLKRLTIQQIKDRGRWERDDTIYSYVQPANSVAVQNSYSKKTKKVLDEINATAGIFFNVPEVGAGWEESCYE